jgi:ABC-2 type transport system ATP-binding protein
MSAAVMPESAVPSTSETTAPAVQTIGLTKRYGELFAVRDLSLSVPAGSVFGLIGPNGAGKSTTFSVLATLLKPTSGTATVMGLDPTTDPAGVRRVLGFMPDQLGVYDNLAVAEYLRFFALSYRIPKASIPDLIDGLLELVDLDVKRTAMVNSLSRGMKQRLSLARALVHDPKVLILDEPASGLDPRARIELRDLIAQLRTMGKTVVVSSHILPELQEMCTHIGILEAGQLLAAGEPRDIVDRLGQGRRVRVRFADGTEATHSVADTAAQAALVRSLVVDEERDVIEVVEESGGLEDLFLRITKGVVQ